MRLPLCFLYWLLQEIFTVWSYNVTGSCGPGGFLINDRSTGYERFFCWKFLFLDADYRRKLNGTSEKLGKFKSYTVMSTLCQLYGSRIVSIESNEDEELLRRMIQKIKYLHTANAERALTVAIGLRRFDTDLRWDDITGTDYIRHRFQDIGFDYKRHYCFMLIENFGTNLGFFDGSSCETLESDILICERSATFAHIHGGIGIYQNKDVGYFHNWTAEMWVVYSSTTLVTALILLLSFVTYYYREGFYLFMKDFIHI